MSMLADRLPLVNKLLYTSDMIGGQAVAQTRNLWLLFFLAPPKDDNLPSVVPSLDLGFLELDPRVYIGIVLAAGRIIEALDDPIIGWWSDRTQSRWGRRLPFVLFSTPFFAIFFALLWLTPSGDPSHANAVYVFIILELFFLANTLSGGPYEALLPEIARSHRDRMSIVAWQFYFGILGALLGLVLTGLIKDAIDFKVMGIIVAAFGLTFRYVGVAGIWRHAPRETPVAQIKLISAITTTLTNTQFLYFIPTFVMFQLSVAMVISWLPFFVKQIVGQIRVWEWSPIIGGKLLGDGAVTSLLTFVALVAMLISAFALWKISNTKGKRWVYSACLLGTAVYMPFLFFAGFIPGIPKLAQGLVMAFLAGVPMAGVNLLPRAITADITDYDELRTGMRREGMFYATQNLFEKVGSSFSPLFLALILLLGETTEDPLGLRMVGLVAGVIAFFGYWLFRGYRLPSTVTVETVRAAGLEIGDTPPKNQD